MKKFSKISVLAICLAAFFTSCIKEDPFEIKTAYLDVSIDTRAAESQHQGDGINDVMLWAFKCESIDASGYPVNVQTGAAAGWRTVYGLDTYETFNAHVQLPMCNTNPDVANETQNYVLIAVINKDTYGTIYDRTQTETVDGVTRYKTLTLGASTTYDQLIKASFDASTKDYWNKAVGIEAVKMDAQGNPVLDENENQVKEETPVYMPVSHWTAFTISEGNTHPDYCLSVTMPVFRAVAKSQLFMKKASDNFELEVYEAKLTCNKLPNEGILLSKLLPTSLVSATPTPTWFGSNPAEVSGSGYPIVRPMMNASGELSDNVKDQDGKITEVGNIATIGNGTDYQFVGSTLIYETPYSCSQAADTDYSEKSVSGDGYYLEVSYRVDNQPFTKKVAIPNAVVRNHDYQIKATVDAGGKMQLSLVVNDWDDVPNNWNFTDNVSATGRLTWAEGTNVDQVSLGTGTDAEEIVTQVKLPKTGSKETNKAECTFTFDTPRDGAKWMASFVGGDVSAFKFIDNDGNLVNTIDGTIDGTQSTLKICTTDDKVASSKSAYLDIVVVTGDGRTLSATAAIFEDSKRPLLVQEATM